MHRVFVQLAAIAAGELLLTEKAPVHHIRDVLRLKAGAQFVVVDPVGNEYLATLQEVSSRGVRARLKPRAVAATSGIQLAIACALAKNAKMDEIVDKLTQLGVSRIIPLFTERVIVRLDRAAQARRHNRWQKIALAASQQSQRCLLPQVDPVRRFSEALEIAREFELKLIPHLADDRKPLAQVLAEHTARKIIVVIGPEGDFSPQELKQAGQAGFLGVSLGPQVLRVDTACYAVASFIQLTE